MGRGIFVCVRHITVAPLLTRSGLGHRCPFGRKRFEIAEPDQFPMLLIPQTKRERFQA
jgi:hypothetical protein